MVAVHIKFSDTATYVCNDGMVVESYNCTTTTNPISKFHIILCPVHSLQVSHILSTRGPQNIDSHRVPSSSWMSHIWDIPYRPAEWQWRPYLITRLLAWHYLSTTSSSFITGLTVADFTHTSSFFIHPSSHCLLNTLTRLGKFFFVLSFAHIGWIRRVGPTSGSPMMFRRVVFFLGIYFILFFSFFFSFSTDLYLSTWFYATGGSFAVEEC